jgi:hypothetical protein
MVSFLSPAFRQWTGPGEPVTSRALPKSLAEEGWPWRRPIIGAMGRSRLQSDASRDSEGALDTFPKWLRHHVRVRGARPAIRLKDRGIWRTWSWAETHENVRALAHALRRLGIGIGDKVAIVGANRPALYWGIAAAQWLRAVPVPVYGDAVADEMAYVLENADVKVALAQDQEQVDKILSIAHIRSFPAARDRGDDGREPHRASGCEGRCRNRCRNRPGPSGRSLDHALHVRDDRPLEGRRALSRALGCRGARYG